ncbi:hypothetical protein FQZ97_839420 [compost metagenome]
MARLLQHGAQQGQLARREFQWLAFEVDRAIVLVELHAAPDGGATGRAVDGFAGAGGAAHQGTQAGFEFVQVKGLGQVVVGAGVQADDAVAHGAARGEDDDRRGQAGGARVAQHLQAVAPGQAQVE